jgi:hypothetical protein
MVDEFGAEFVSHYDRIEGREFESTTRFNTCLHKVLGVPGSVQVRATNTAGLSCHQHFAWARFR